MARGTLVPSSSSEGKRDTSEERPEIDDDDKSARSEISSGCKREWGGSLSIPYKVGQLIDVLDSVDRWAEAKVSGISSPVFCIVTT